jgi:hypothetical protein
MTEHPFNNDATPAERREVFENKRVADERRASTYHQHAINEASEAGGRFRTVNETTVIGAASLNYPAGPSWTHDPTGIEPPLGVDVNELRPTGEPHEVIKSLGEGRAPMSVSPSDVVSSETPSPSFTDDNEPEAA